MIGEYNTQRPGIILKEYGRNIQKLIDYIRSIPDKKKRTELAYTLVDLMKQLVPSTKEGDENPQRLWDDLYIVANFELDVDNPYPIPDDDVLFKKPARIPYPQSPIHLKHYGKNIERLIVEAIKKDDPKDREDAVIYLGKLMKTFYSSWNKESLDDSVILKDLKQMSKGTLTMDLEKVREGNLFEKLFHETKKPHSHSRSGGHGHGRKRSSFKRHRRRD